MNEALGRHVASGRAVLVAIAVALVVFQASGLSQGVAGNLMYNSGQGIAPMYHGWELLPDGSRDLHFGYLNRNWEEELDIPIGPDNNISPAPYGPDGGQPTHFLPRHSRWQFKVRVPADWGKNGEELVWTLTAHGETVKAYASLNAAFVQDHYSRQREFYGRPPEGNNDPVVTLEGSRQLTAKVGEPVTLAATVTDDGIPVPRAAGGGGGDDGGANAPRSGRRRRVVISGSVVGSGERNPSHGLRFAWYVYRGAGEVTFNPPQFKVWEDNRAGANSPFSPGWTRPPTPPGDRWMTQATFAQPGTFVIRGWAHDGYLLDYEDVTITVRP